VIERLERTRQSGYNAINQSINQSLFQAVSP